MTGKSERHLAVITNLRFTCTRASIATGKRFGLGWVGGSQGVSFTINAPVLLRQSVHFRIHSTDFLQMPDKPPQKKEAIVTICIITGRTMTGAMKLEST